MLVLNMSSCCLRMWPLFAWLCLLAGPGYASVQQRSISVPFDYDNGFIVVEVTINRGLPIRLLFDTGSEYTILTEPYSFQDLNEVGADVIRLVGSDLSEPILGVLTRSNRLEMGPITLASHAIIAADACEIALRDLTTKPVSGILGTGSFGAYAITVDYGRQVLRLTRSTDFKPRRRATALPIDVESAKPFVWLQSQIHADFSDSLRLLLDTGAALEMLVYSAPGDTAIYPPHLVVGPIGQGLGGTLLGYVGRSDSLQLGPYALVGLVTHFQVAEDSSDLSLVTHRNGILGNRTLDRFIVTIDYPGRMLYLEPSGKFRRPRPYDRSGMRLIRDGLTGSSVRVQLVSPGTPAFEIGMQKGDEIVSVNGMSVGAMSLEHIHAKLRSRPQRRIKLKVRRDGREFKTQFRLRELI